MQLRVTKFGECHVPNTFALNIMVTCKYLLSKKKKNELKMIDIFENNFTSVFNSKNGYFCL